MKRTQEGFPFSFETSACDTCPGRCCTGESGAIWVTPAEVKAIAKHLGQSTTQFIARYTRRSFRRLSLTEKPWPGDQHACVFFDGHCTIYKVRPEQCRTFPFWNRYRKGHFDELTEECPGVTLSPDAT